MEQIIQVLHTKEKQVMNYWTTTTTMGNVEVIYHLMESK